MSPVVTHHVPVALTTFVGRSGELLEIEGLVAERRLVTLTGEGGCGKSRLAAQLVARLCDRWEDGLWWVDLGSVSDPGLVSRTVASALELLIEPGGDPVASLTGQLEHRQMLLCLDTCEHLLEAAAALAEALLQACPGVSVLATSREPLGISGESVRRVPSLRESEAIDLFRENRASLVSPGFSLDRNLADLRAICARVDGIPLAIELAAAWVRSLTPTQIAHSLANGFQLLTGRATHALPRQQTMAASIKSSHSLLLDIDRLVFRRLAVFSASFTIDAVRHMCSEIHGTGPDDALTVLTRLVDKSLVVVVQQDGAEASYRLLDTMREYAESRLQDADEVEIARSRHLDWYLALVENADAGLDVDQDLWRPIVDLHRDNIHTALRWGLSQADPRARLLAAGMARYWLIRGDAHEGLQFLDAAIAIDPHDLSALQARLLIGLAMVAMISGRWDLTADATERGLRIATEAGDTSTQARGLALSTFPIFFVDPERSASVAAEAEALAIVAGDPFARDWARVMHGYTMVSRDRHAEALTLGQPAFERSMARTDRFCATFARGIELWPAMYTGDIRRAVTIGEEVIAIGAGDYFAVGSNAANVALALGMSGDLHGAQRMMDSIVKSIDEAPDRDVVGFMVTLGLLNLWAGNLDHALRWSERGARVPDGDPDNWNATRCLPAMIGALRLSGRTDEARRHAVRALALEKAFNSASLQALALDEQAIMSSDSDPALALQLHHEALALRVDSNLRTFLADSLDGLASLAARKGAPAEAIRLLAASSSGREEMGYPRPPVDAPTHEALITSLRSAAGDETFEAEWNAGANLSLDEAVAIAMRGRGRRNRPATGWESLTPTELNVVRLVVEGLTNPEIGDRLFISRATVKTHLSHVYARLNVSNRTELATLAGARLDGTHP